MLLPVSLSIVSLLVSSALAYDYSQWSPPGPDDSRSPCPGLNSMANHGILPHNGKGLTVKMLTDAMQGVFNIGFDLRTILAVGGVFSSPNALRDGTMDLADLDKHNYIEHDGSLSRAPIHQGGDDHTFRQDIFDQVLSFFNNTTGATTNIDEAAKAHLHRVQADSKTKDFTYGSKQTFLAMGETALYLMALGDPVTGVTPVNYIRTLFEEERIPYEEGWRTPTTEISLGNTLEMLQKIASADGELKKEGAITNATLAKALVGLDTAAKDVPQFIQVMFNYFGLSDLLGSPTS